MLRIVTDGATDMPEGWQEEYQINILPLRVSFGEKTYTQGENFGFIDFYNLVRQTRIIPKTSLPSPGQVVDFYRKIAQKGDTILSMHVTGKLSGTLATIQTAAQELKEEYRIFPFDSGAGSAAVGFMCREARLLDRAGKTPEQILKRLEKIRSRLTVIFTLDTLEFAYLSGRINAFQSALSSLLKVKPIVILKDGLLEMADRVRTRQKALEQVLQTVRKRIGNRPANVAIVHAADPQAAQQMLERIRNLLNIKDSFITDLSIPVAANLGPGTIGIVAYPVDEEEEE
jgi:DegV family protein with EDD domain